MQPPINQATQLSHHLLAIGEAEQSLDFYQRIIGMTLLQRRRVEAKTHYFLGFEVEMPGEVPIPAYPACVLELVHDPQSNGIFNHPEGDVTPGYWKLALAVADLGLARTSLLQQGISVSDPVQVPDVAYLCHLQDPDGYCIELIQHRMQANHIPQAANNRFALRTATCLALVTLRVRDAQRSVEFYQQQLGLRLLSRQQVEHRGFTLYFLSADRQAPPSSDVDNIAMCEWLWQRPYAQLELQHLWGDGQPPGLCYRTDPASGFLQTRWLVSQLAGDTHRDAVLQRESLLLLDPDGYRVQLLQSG